MNLSPEFYWQVFHMNKDGKQVLEELCRLFYDKPSYSKGEPEHTAYNEGRKAVLHHILLKLEQSQSQIEEEKTPHDD